VHSLVVGLFFCKRKGPTISNPEKNKEAARSKRICQTHHDSSDMVFPGPDGQVAKERDLIQRAAERAHDFQF
jgi:hypothetical protein